MRALDSIFHRTQTPPPPPRPVWEVPGTYFSLTLSDSLKRSEKAYAIQGDLFSSVHY